MRPILMLLAFAVYCAAFIGIAKVDEDLAVGFVLFGMFGLIAVVVGLSGVAA